MTSSAASLQMSSSDHPAANDSDRDNNYGLPNDAEEHIRLNLQHEALKFQAGGNFKAPLRTEDVHDILDICCGTGQWAIEMAEAFPGATVIGIDIALPGVTSTLPRNCTFQQGDVTKRLPYAEDSFDFVQVRIVPSLPNRVGLMSEITRVLRHGGIVQLIEPDESFSATLTASGTEHKRSPKFIEFDSYLARLPHAAPAADKFSRLSRSWSVAPQLHPLVAEHTANGVKAYADVHVEEIVIPVGGWHTDPEQQRVGSMMASVQEKLMDGFCAALLAHNILTPEHFEAIKREVMGEIHGVDGQEAWKICIPFVWVWGTKS